MKIKGLPNFYIQFQNFPFLFVYFITAVETAMPTNQKGDYDSYSYSDLHDDQISFTFMGFVF